jgi:capsular exopolysaccharide synthesis family protein
MIPEPDDELQQAGPVDSAGVEGTAFQIRRFLEFLRKFWWIPMLTLAVGIVLEAAYVHWKQPMFVSKASMWETMKLTLPEGGVFSEDMQNYMGTLNGLLQSETLRQQALAILRTSTNTTPIIYDSDGEPIKVDVSVSGNAKSSVFLVQATSSNPLFTKVYLDAIMEAYLDYKKNVRQEVSGDTLASISEQMQRWERDLKNEQDALLAFERTNNLAILQEEANVAGSYLTRLKTQLSDLQLEALLLDAATNNPGLAASGTFAPDSSMGSTPAGGASSERQSSQDQVELLKLQREKLSKYLRPKHPKIVQLDADIEHAQQLQEIYGRQNRDQLATARQANQMKTANVQASIAEWEAKVVEANATITEADRLKLNIQRIQSVYDRLVLLVQNVGISRNINQENLAILEHALPPKRSYTSEKAGLALAIFGGLGSGLGIIFLIAMRDDRFTSVNEVNAKLGDSVVGLLPEVVTAAGVAMPLLTLNDPRHIYAESYRSLRSSLLFLNAEGPQPKVLLITSAMPGEGKSTVAANLARTLALSGSKVLLLDADLRKGRLHHLLALQREPGLAELLIQSCDPATVMQKDSLPNLTFIACGEIHSGNPGDLFLAAGLDQLLARWRAEFDYVVIDSSPLFAADDVSCLAPKVDGTLFVVRSRQSSARAAREALEMLARRQATVLGVIFNGADTAGRSYYYYKYADYHGTQGTAKSS